MKTGKNSILKLMTVSFLMLCSIMISLPASAESKPAGKRLINPAHPQYLHVATSGGAIRSNAGFAANTLAANDDGSTSLVPIGFDMVFGGQTRSYLYVNNNGNVTFDGSLRTYTPFSLNAGGSIIAPFFADVDTRGSGSALVTYGNDTVDGHEAFGVNWVNVGYYSYHTDKLNSFQLVLIDRSDIAAGCFDVEFNYGSITWETGDASGGQDGYGGTPARAGYSDGTNTADGWLELSGSGVTGALLNTGNHALVSNSVNSSQPGRYVFHIRSHAAVSMQLLDDNPVNTTEVAVVGAAADGATQIRVRVKANAPGAIALVYDRGSASSTPDGAFVPAPGSIGTLNNLTLQSVNGSYQADAIYTVPEGLINEVTHDIYFHGVYTPADGGEIVSLEYQTLRLSRPPVILVHGLWSSSGAWTEPTAGTLAKLGDSGFQVPQVFDYSGFFGTKASSHFKYYAPRLLEHIQQQLKDIRNGHIAITRVDVVGHSMGGLVTRAMVSHYEPIYYHNTFGKGLIRRFVTLGTPHLGSHLADVLWLVSLDPVSDIFSLLIGHPIYAGAIEDLAIASPALFDLGSTAIPSFAAIGDVSTTNLGLAPLIDLLYNAFRFFGISVSGVNTSSRSSFANSLMNGLASDAIVPGISQQGGLSAGFTQRFSPVFHWDETGSTDMGNVVTTLLSGDVSAFAEGGFPQPYRFSAAKARTGRQAVRTRMRRFTETPLVTITSPAEGSAFHSGDPITITAVPVSGATVAAVLITLGDGSDQSSLMQSQPFSATFTIANTFVGTLTYNVAARDTAGNVSMTSGTVVVQANATLQSLSVAPSPLSFSCVGTAQLRVNGLFSDGISRNVSGAGTTYSSSNSAVVSVDGAGVATANSTGNVIITVRNGGLSTQTVAQVALQTPGILGVSPSSVVAGAAAQTVTLQGLYLGGADSIQFLSGGQPDPQVTAENIQADGTGSTLTATVTAAAGAAPGAHTIVVTTPGGTSSTTADSGNQINVLSMKSLSVTKSGSGAVTSSPSGISCGATCSASFVVNSTVVLSATPATGYAFAYWSGACSSASPTCAFVITADTGVTAVFDPVKTKQNKLTVTKKKVSNGDGTVASADGMINCGSTCNKSYYPGAPVSLSATPGANSVFTGWSGACTGSDTCIVAMDKAKSVSASFTGPQKLTVSKKAKDKGVGTVTSSPAGIDCGPICNAMFAAKTPVVLSAVPSTGSVFTGWSGACAGSDTCIVAMDKAKSVSASFTGPQKLTVSKQSVKRGTGTVTSSPGGISCAVDCTVSSAYYLLHANVTLTALPDQGSTFAGWKPASLNCSGTSCNVIMQMAQTVTAVFSAASASRDGAISQEAVEYYTIAPQGASY
jgi:pimeloyl-ACP methyl ester carboxylesterase